MVNRVVIAGAGHAAGQAAVTLRQKKFDGEIVMIGEEPYYPYQRPPLSKKFLAGELPADRLHLKPDSYYAEAKIEVRLKTRVETIDRKDKSVSLSSGDKVSYDTLILATGAVVRRLALPGTDLPGVHYLRNIQDVDRMREDMAPGRRMVVRVMSRVVSTQVSDFYEREHRSHGVKLRLSTGVTGVSGGSRVTSVNLHKADPLAADLVLIGIGIEPNVGLASASGLEVNNGIVVDDRCRSSDPDIYAIGDCTFHPNGIFGRSVRLESVHNALEQARTAAQNICGEELHYCDVPWFWSDQYDIKLQIAGLSQGHDQTVLRGKPDSRSFSCLYLKNGILIAVDAINCPKDFMQAKPLIATRASLPVELLANADIALKDLGARS
jgi:3-phenylpropionate/trans-cinnamate dioxygenase ferredoxin reductase subunit